MKKSLCKVAAGTVLIAGFANGNAGEGPRLALTGPDPGTDSSERHRLGVNFTAWFNFQAKVQASRQGLAGILTGDPAVDSRQDRQYDDGFNKVNSLGNPTLALTGPADTFPRTTYFGFASNSQFSPATGPTGLNPGSLSFHSMTSLGGGYGRLGGNDAAPSVELTYSYLLRSCERWFLELGVGVSYLSVDWDQRGSVDATAGVLVDTYRTGTVDPRVDVAAGGVLPYVGTFQPKPGVPWIGSLPTRLLSEQAVVVDGQRRVSLDAFLVRLGPWLDYRFTPSLRVGVGVGPVLGYTDASLNYSDLVRLPGGALPISTQSGRLDGDGFVYGMHSEVHVRWEFSPNWTVQVGLHHLLVEPIRFSNQERAVEIRLTDGFGASLGISRRF